MLFKTNSEIPTARGPEKEMIYSTNLITATEMQSKKIERTVSEDF